MEELRTPKHKESDGARPKECERDGHIEVADDLQVNSLVTGKRNGLRRREA
jgi:hypothetical protein